MMSFPTPLSLFQNCVLSGDICCSLTRMNLPTSQIAAFADLLDKDEASRAQALVREEDKEYFIISHGLLRQALAAETGMAPEALEIRRNEHGKPRLDMPGAPHFSFSTSQNLAAIAITDAQPVGMDVEVIAPIDVLLMLPMVGHEADGLILNLPEAQQLSAFYRLWTGKEAILKAMGTGFQANPREIDLGPAFLNGSAQTVQVDAFGQNFDLICEETSTAMVSLALSSRLV